MLLKLEMIQISEIQPGMVVHTYNPSYLGYGHRRIINSKPVGIISKTKYKVIASICLATKQKKKKTF
jgi:hypothetical protein